MHLHSLFCRKMYLFLAFDAEVPINDGRAIFENLWEGALLYSPGQINP